MNNCCSKKITSYEILLSFGQNRLSRETDEGQKARSGIIDKLKSFGSDVTSNIIANIFTNPIIWSGYNTKIKWLYLSYITYPTLKFS